MTREKDVMVPMRDGVHLNATIFFPKNHKGPVPTILVRTTYGGYSFDWIKFFVNGGYAVIIQNVRGRYGSEGRYLSPHRFSRPDGYDTVSWIVKQPWSTGKVGTFGCSYLGENQIMLGAERHPNHIAMIVDGAGGAIGNAKGSYGYFGVYENGVFNLASALGWFTSNGAIDFRITPAPEDLGALLAAGSRQLPVSNLAREMVSYQTGYDDITRYSLTDDWWMREGYISQDDTFSTATLHVNSWYDQTVHDTFRLAQHMSENRVHPRAKHQYLLIGPGTHCRSGKLKEGSISIGNMEIEYVDLDYKGRYLAWFDYWLKDKGSLQQPPVEYYMIHASTWKTARQWPPERHHLQRYYLLDNNGLSVNEPLLESHGNQYYEYQYDPADPVISLGGNICCTSRNDDLEGAVDQTSLKQRQDVVLFESQVLENDVDLVGSAKLLLYVSSSAKDTDFTVKLVDQFPDGPAYNLQDTVVRLRYRNGVDKPSFTHPGSVYPVKIELRPIAYRFRPGHKIAVYLSSSNFPRLARNLNTDEDPLQSGKMTVATNRIYYGTDNPSYIELPVTD